MSASTSLLAERNDTGDALTRLQRVLLVAGAPAIVIFAAALVWVVGHRGIFLFDHGIILDGGYRVYLGQVPYRDIYMAYLPGALWIQAIFFWLWGVNFSAMIVPACLFNAVAAAIVMRICWRLFPGRVAACLAGGLLTAVWFQAPYGGLLHEDCGFTFAALALWLLFETEGTGPRCKLLLCAAGILLSCAVLCKQNAGGFFIPLVFLVLFLQRFPSRKEVLRSWLAVASGIAAGAAAFIFWLWRYSDFQRMRLFALEIPSQVGRERILHSLSHSFKMIIGAAAPSFLPLFDAIWVTVAIAVGLFAVFGTFSNDRRKRALAIAAFLSLGLFFYQQVFQLTALNEAQNGLPFLGLMFALVLAASVELFDGNIECGVGGGQAHLSIPRKAVRRCLGSLGVLFSVLLFIYGFTIDVQRLVHFDRGTRFTEKINVRAASGTLWGEPNLINKTVLKKSEFEAVVHFLEQHQGNFFTFPDATILYSFVGRVPPQPLLYFTEGHSYRQQDIPWLDREILASLQKNHIRYFIQEKDAYLGNAGQLREFPLVWNWLHASFSPVADFGFFDVWERRQ